MDFNREKFGDFNADLSRDQSAYRPPALLMPTDSFDPTNLQSLPCFTPSALIVTALGEVPVEDLRAGDKVLTRDNGFQEVRWTGFRTLRPNDQNAPSRLNPILIRAGALGNDLPRRDLLVSPQHRVLICGSGPQRCFEEPEVLVAAEYLVGLPGISVMPSTQTTYLHFMFDRHEVVLSDGAWTESFQPKDESLGSVGHEVEKEILELFPELGREEGLLRFTTARRALTKEEALLLQA